MDGGALALDFAALVLVGSLICLDRKGAFQVMISQPIIAVPLLGLTMGDVGSAVYLGAALQLLWMSSLLVGASVPPNETVASIVIGSVALLYARHVDCPGPADGDLATEALAILIGAPFGEVGRRLEIGLDRANQRLATRADEAARAREPGALSRLPWIGLMRNFGLNAVLITLGVAVGMGLIWLARPRLGPSLETTLAVIRLYVVPALGIAVALSTVRRRRGLAFAAASFALGLIGIQMVELG